MLASKVRDYTTMPVGKRTRQGSIALCERCGRRGAYVKIAIPTGTIEKWLHSRKFTFLIDKGSETACIRSNTIVDGKVMNGWGWSDWSRHCVILRLI